MAIILNSVKYYPELSNSFSSNLIGNKYDRIRCEIDFTVAERILADGNRNLKLADQNFPTDDYISCQFPVFQNFQTEDLIALTIIVGNVVGTTNYTIIEKVSDYIIRVDSNLTSEEPPVSKIELITPIQSFNYFFGIIENDESINFLSKVDGSLQNYVYDNLPTIAGSPQQMTYLGTVESEIGSATISRTITGTANAQQRFNLVHYFDIDPVILNNQLQDELNDIAPIFFRNGNALKHIFKLEASSNLTNQNFIQTILKVDLNGNTGYFDKNFNLSISNYSVQNLVYKRDTTGEVIDKLELTNNVNRVEFSLINSVDSPFSNNNTKFIAQFSTIPQFDEDYIDNGISLVENFTKDRGLQTIGALPISGDFFGTDGQVFTEISATFVTASQIDVVLKIQLSNVILSKLQSASKRTYNLAITTQNHLLSTVNADKATIKIDTSDFFVDNSDPTMIGINRNFLELTETDFATQGKTIIDAKKEDRIWSEYLFFIDRNTREFNDITLSKLTFEIIGKKTDGTKFVFENFVKDIDSSLFVPDNFGAWENQYFDFSDERQYLLPTNDERNKIVLKRREDLDTIDLKYYAFRYPFVIRFEKWIENLLVNSDMFDINEISNGLNNDWNRTQDTANWSVLANIKIEAIKDNNLLIFEDEQEIIIDDYLENVDWINETIVFKDSSGNILQNGGQSYILGYDFTFVEISKEYVGANLPLLSNVEWWAHLQVTNGQGSVSMHLLNSMYDYTENSCLRSIDSTNLIKKSVAGNVFKAELKIDSNLLPQGAEIDFSARIYDNTTVVSGKKMEDGTLKLMESGIVKQEE